MHWRLQPIEINDIPALRQQIRAAAKAGEPSIENMRCVVMVGDDPCIYLYTALDWAETPDTSELVHFSLCQPLDKKSNG